MISGPEQKQDWEQKTRKRMLRKEKVAAFADNYWEKMDGSNDELPLIAFELARVSPNAEALA